MSSENDPLKPADSITVSDISLHWDVNKGVCTFEGLPVAMMWVDSTLAGLMQAVQKMVGEERFNLCLQSEGRKSVEDDWQVISQFDDFATGFSAIAKVAAVAGWGRWEIISLDVENKKAVFQVSDSWEGLYQKGAGVCWGSGMLAGKLAGYCSKLFGENCWADQQKFIAKESDFDTFVVSPSARVIEAEIETLLLTDNATKADLTVALEKLRKEIGEKQKVEAELKKNQQSLDERVKIRTEALLKLNDQLQHEIAERIKTEKKLRQETQKAQRYLDVVGVMLVALDRRGRVQLINQMGCEILEVTEEQAVGKDWFALFLPTDIRSEVKEVFKKLMSEELEPVEYYENRVLTGTGKEKLIAFHNSILEEDGVINGVLFSGEDVTEKKEAESRLRESEERFRSMAENSSDLIWEFDENEIFTYVSAKIEDLLGYTPEEIIGRSFFDVIPEEERDAVAKAFYPVKEARQSFSNLENLNQHKDGSHLTLESSGRPIFDQNDNFKGYRGIGRDITERKKMQAQLQQSQKLEAIGTLAGGIAHDFNNLLTPILGYSELLEASARERRDQSAQDFSAEIVSAAGRARDLVKQILALSRQQKDKLLPVQIHLIINEAMKLLRSSIPKSIDFETDIAKSGYVLADPTKIHQIIMNLCTNAYHSMRQSGGVLRVSLCEEQSESSQSVSGSDIVLRVADTGHGIDKYSISRVFEPYFTTKEKGEGTGLGLAVVHSIVLSLGGTIDVASTVGKGTVFTVRLPMLNQEDIVKGFSAEASVVVGGSERVLVVDDEVAIARYLKSTLERLGYTVTAMTDPAELLELFAANPHDFDLVVTDMTMPGINGAELSRKILEIRPQLPIILCTGFSETINEAKARQLGVSAFLLKPVSLEELARSVREVLTRSSRT